MRWMKILAGVVGVLAVAVIGLVVFVATLDLNAYKSEVEAAVEGETGRKLRIEGALDLTWSPRPTLTTDRVRFANADWGSRADMATVGKLEASVEVIPLLSGTLDVQRVAMSDVEILLERNAEGAGNWEFADAGSGGTGGGSGGGAPLLRSVELNNIAIHWKPAPDAEDLVIKVPHLVLAADGPTSPLDVTMQADVDGNAFTLVGTLPPVAEAMRPGATLPVDLQGSIADMPILFAANLRHAQGADGAITSISADRMSLSVADVSAVGTASVELGGVRPRIVADLKSERIKLPSDDAASDESSSGGDPLDTPLPLDLLLLADGRVTLAVDELTAGDLKVTEVSAIAALEDGVLQVEPLSALLSDGRIAAAATVDASESTAKQALVASWKGADFGKLAHTLHGSDTLEARGDAALDLNARGESVRDMLASLGGVAWISAKDGKIANEDWELIAEDLTGRFLPFLDESTRGTLNCAVGRWSIKRGVAETVILMIDSDRVTIAGEGTVDLARETLDMKLTPSPKDASLISLATPIIFTGDIRDPDIAPDPVAVAKGVGSIVAGTAVAGPLALVLPFVSSGSDEPACAEAVPIAEGRKAMPTGGGSGGAASREQQDKPGSIKGLFDSIRKAVE